jgi:hypothetical protein
MGSPPSIQHHGTNKNGANTINGGNQTFNNSIANFGTGLGSFKMPRPYHLSIVS